MYLDSMWTCTYVHNDAFRYAVAVRITILSDILNNTEQNFLLVVGVLVGTYKNTHMCTIIKFITQCQSIHGSRLSMRPPGALHMTFDV